MQQEAETFDLEAISNARAKRRIYIACLLLMSIVLFCAWIFRPAWDIYRWITAPVFLLVLMGLVVVLWRESMTLVRVETLMLATVAAMPLSRQIWLYYQGGTGEQWFRMLGNNYWATSAVLVMAFTLGGRRRGLVTGVAIVLLSVMIAVIGVSTQLPGGDLPANSIMYIVGSLLFLTMFLALMSVATITKDQWHTALSRAAVYSRWALTDKLTGLANRHAGADILARHCEAAKSQDRSLSVIMGDLDNFKQVNDMEGHAVGDAVLTGVAKIMRASVRDSDAVIRWGGEEFLIVVDDSNLEEARMLAERCRNAIEAEPVAGIRMTMTFGVAQYEPGDTQDSLLARADENLYTGKGISGNRVEV